MGLASFNRMRRLAAEKQKKHRDPLDHDGDGKKGGAPKPVDDAGILSALRAEYEAKLGKRPFMGWDAVELQRRMAAAG